MRYEYALYVNERRTSEKMTPSMIVLLFIDQQRFNVFYKTHARVVEVVKTFLWNLGRLRISVHLFSAPNLDALLMDVIRC